MYKYHISNYSTNLASWKVTDLPKIYLKIEAKVESQNSWEKYSTNKK